MNVPDPVHVHPSSERRITIYPLEEKSILQKTKKKLLRMWFAIQQASNKEESDFVETRHQAKAIL